jgi:flavin-dependent thymidylate synthase
MPAMVGTSRKPRVRLVNAFADPYDNAVATARTCYSAKVIEVADVRKDEKARELRDEIARSTYAAGHHTTLQHAHFQFVLEDVSRQLLWSFLHAHPFYNSEQVSQRYVAVRPDRVLVPELAEPALTLYRDTVDAQMRSYQELAELLSAPVREAYFQVFPARRRHADREVSALSRRAQEVARYVLPVATQAHLYHTVSGLTLHRYHRLANSLDVPAETRAVVVAMVDLVRAMDPLFFKTIEDPIPLEETHEYRTLAALRGVTPSPSARRFREAFDEELGGRAAKLVDWKVNTERELARAVRQVLGLVPDELEDSRAIDLVLSPAVNPTLGETLTLTSLGKLSRALFHPHYTFQKKLSHSADSQDQRHRLTPGTRPILAAHYVGGEPDVVTPALIAMTPKARECFDRTMQRVWRAIDNLLADGVPAEHALYLLPNAFPIRFQESGDLAALHHKWTTRLCYNAQEEIWRATLDEVREVRAVHRAIGAHILPPCGLRDVAGTRPACPEGKRFCGVSVWKLGLDDYRRVI